MLKRLLIWLAAAIVAAFAASATPVLAQGVATSPLLLSAKADPCPGASLCARFTGQAGYKAGGAITSNFAALPGLTVTANSFRYGENLDGSLVPFQANQPRLTTKGLGVFEATTNLVVRSQEFGNGSSWSLNASTIINDAAVAPDGTLTAEKLVESTANSFHLVGQVLTVAASTNYTMTLYAKAGERSRLQVGGAAGAWGGSSLANFDLSTCTTLGFTGVGFTGQSAQAAANGWCRLVVTGVSTATPSAAQAFQILLIQSGTTTVYTGDGTSGAYIWGADLRAGAYPVPYCPTTSTTATCAADAITLNYVPGADGWAFAQYLNPVGFAAGNPRLLNDSATSVSYLALDSNGARLNTYNGTTAINTPTLSAAAYPAGAVSRAAVTWDASGRAITSNGTGGVLSDANGIGSYSGLRVGAQNSGGTGAANTYIQKIAFGSGKLSSTQLTQLTSADTSSLNVNFASGSYSAVINGQQFQTTSLSNMAAAMGAAFTFTNSTGGYLPWSNGTLTWVPPNTPRISDLGLLAEPASTNLVLQSQEFETASWTTQNASVNANVVTAPDGTLTADTLTEDAINSNHGVISAVVTKAASATTYTYDIYAKRAVGARNLWIIADGGSFANRAEAVIDLSSCSVLTAASVTGTFTSPAISTQPSVGGACRAILTFTTGAETQVRGRAFLASGSTTLYVGDGVSSIAIWGAQLEALSFATSYIPTTSASATRSADVAYFTGLAFATPLTLLGQAVTPSSVISTYSPAIAAISDGTNNNTVRLMLSSGGPGNARGVIAVGGASQADIQLAAVPANTVVCEALRANTNDVALAAQGSAPTKVTTATMPTGLTTLTIGARAPVPTVTDWWAGFVQRVAVLPYAANDNEESYRSACNW